MDFNKKKVSFAAVSLDHKQNVKLTFAELLQLLFIRSGISQQLLVS